MNNCKFCNKEINSSKSYCSKNCYYEWKKSQPNGRYSRNYELENLKNILSLYSKEEIYNFLCSKIFEIQFFSNKNTKLTEREKILNIVSKYNLKIDTDNINSIEDFYIYFKGHVKCASKKCNKTPKFYSFRAGYSQYCSDKCLNERRSFNMTGEKNIVHKFSEEVKKRIAQKNSERIKLSIKEGRWTPNVTNSWTRNRISININGKEVKLRSSWEAYFQLFYPNLEYEKVRIQYQQFGNNRNYIVDFVDRQRKVIYEIKPSSERKCTNNYLKREAADKWCIENGYSYIEIDENWFVENYDERLLDNQENAKNLKRLLKQFI